MAIGNETNILFVPYRPSYSSKQPFSGGPAISQQKHAAREYHRKAKLQRLANKSGTTHKRQPQPKIDINVDQSNPASRPILPRKNTFLNGTESDESYTIKDLGDGKLDPFYACIPQGVPDYVLDILDHVISYQWPIFFTSKTEMGASTVKFAVLRCAMSSPAAFYTTVFAGVTHSAFAHMGGPIPKENTTLRLAFKTQAIKALTEEIKSLRGEPSDALLLAIVTLGVHGSGESLAPPDNPNKPLSPLALAQNLQYYGSMSWETAHIEAVRHVVEQRGGLQKLKMPGLANAIALGDIFLSFQRLSTPSYPLMVPTSYVMSKWPSFGPETTRPTLKKLGSGFRDLPESFTADPLLNVIDKICETTIGYDNYLRAASPHPSIERIVWARSCLQHDLLSLPDRSQEGLQHDSCLYELCRMGTLAYMLLVLFPVPRIAGMHPYLAERLLITLNRCVTLGMWEEYPGLLLWATVLGSIVAEETMSLRRLYVEMSNGTPVKHTVNAWSLVRDICASFLWYEECDADAKSFWNEVCKCVE